MADTARRNISSQPTDRALWLGMLGPPVAWFVHFLAIWAIAEWGCLAGWGRFAILGIDVVTALVALAAILALPIVAAAWLLAWRYWRRAGEDERDSRSVYMSLGGVILGILFGALIVLETIPTFVLPPCG